MNDFRYLKNQELLEKLHRLVGLEKKTTAEIVAMIAEVDRRKLFLDLGHTSLFSYLTTGMGYTPASAQRRIDAARLLSSVPEMRGELESGALNLMQISVLSQSLRQKKKESPKVSLGVGEKRVQQDESLRLELTLSKEQQEKLQLARKLLSHKHPSLSWAELFSVLAEELIKRRDPRREPKRKSKRASPRPELTGKNESEKLASTFKTEVTRKCEPQNSALTKDDTTNLENDFKMEAVRDQRSADKQEHFALAIHRIAMVNPDQDRTKNLNRPSKRRPRIMRKAIPFSTKRAIHRRDHSCQWIDPISKQKCNSRFQLELDHIKPVWAGGKNQPDNLQLLCRVHNQLKYKRRSQSRSANVVRSPKGLGDRV